MPRVRTLLIVAIFASACVPPAEPAPQSDGGCFSFEPEALDFGEVRTGTFSVQKVRVQNHTGEILLLRTEFVVDAFRPSPDGNPFVDPGGFGYFDVRFSPPDGRLHLAELEIGGSDRCRQRLPVRGLGSGRLEVDPTRLEFGGVDLFDSKELEVKVTNTRRSTVILDNLRIVDDQTIRPGFTPPFNIVGPTRLELAPLASATILVAATPPYGSSFTARLLGDAPSETVSVPLSMLGGTPVAELSRTQLDVPIVEFTPLPQNVSFLERHLTIRNVGRPDGALPLRFQEPALEVEREDGGIATDEFQLVAPAAISGGDEGLVSLRYLPRQFGLQRFRVLIRTNEVDQPERVVTFTANTVTLQACTGVSAPTQTIFTDANDGGSTATVIFTNRGSTRCVLDDVHVRDEQFSPYRVLDGGLEQLELAPGETHSVLLAGPSITGPRFIGELNFHVLSPNSLNQMVRLILPP